ncbi:MAG: DUF86 domain-containing protein [Candidatus Dadabacteria bacterium]|nr:DUF86 domain-containing protein [Candidatus Dadabacteria bacterium]
MLRDDAATAGNILDAARKAIEFSSGRSRADLDSDEMLALSLVHLPEIVGEAASQVSEGYRAEHPELPWRKMIGLRNRLIHGYFNVNMDIVWDTVMTDLPPLVKQLEALVKD